MLIKFLIQLFAAQRVTLTFDTKKEETTKIKTPPARAKKSASMTLYVPSELSRSDSLGSACKLLKRGGVSFFFVCLSRVGVICIVDCVL